VQLAGGYADTMSRCAQLIADNLEVDFIDINLGCPIDVVNEKAAGCALAARPTKLAAVIGGMRKVMPNLPLTIKLRTGLKEEKRTAHETIGKLVEMNLSPELITLHPRSKEQRYSRLAHWDYVEQCVQAAQNVPFWACGDVLSYEDYYHRLDQSPIAGVMIGRGALMKPWIFTEIEERRHWDISSSERLGIIKQFVHFGLDHWGSDDEGVTRTRRFLLEWLSFQHRYIPVGLLELPPQKINDKPPGYFGRNEMETLLSSPASSDWLSIAEMFLGPAPDGFLFLPKHRASAY